MLAVIEVKSRDALAAAAERVAAAAAPPHRPRRARLSLLSRPDLAGLDAAIRRDAGRPSPPAAPLARCLAGRRLADAGRRRSARKSLSSEISAPNAPRPQIGSDLAESRLAQLGSRADLPDNARGERSQRGFDRWPDSIRSSACSLLLALPVVLGGCPLAIVGGLAAAGGAGYAANQERGVAGTADDFTIKTNIQNAWLKANPTDAGRFQRHRL